MFSLFQRTNLTLPPYASKLVSFSRNGDIIGLILDKSINFSIDLSMILVEWNNAG